MRLSTTLPTHLHRTVHWVGRAVVDAVLPPRGLACGVTVDEPDALCATCWNAMHFFPAPWCAVCGLPFAHPIAEGTVCGACAASKPHWDRARAVLRYDRHSRSLVLSLKYGDRTHLARSLGLWMRRAGSEVLDAADLLVPVPLHWPRLFARRYNQAALLAHAIHAAGEPP